MFGLFLCVIPDQIFTLLEPGIKLERRVRTSRTVSHLHDDHFVTVWNDGDSTRCDLRSAMGRIPTQKGREKGAMLWLSSFWLIQIRHVRAEEFEPREGALSSGGRERLPAASPLLQFTRVFQSAALLK